MLKEIAQDIEKKVGMIHLINKTVKAENNLIFNYGFQYITAFTIVIFTKFLDNKRQFLFNRIRNQTIYIQMCTVIAVTTLSSHALMPDNIKRSQTSDWLYERIWALKITCLKYATTISIRIVPSRRVPIRQF